MKKQTLAIALASSTRIRSVMSRSQSSAPYKGLSFLLMQPVFLKFLVSFDRISHVIKVSGTDRGFRNHKSERDILIQSPAESFSSLNPKYQFLQSVSGVIWADYLHFHISKKIYYVSRLKPKHIRFLSSSWIRWVFRVFICFHIARGSTGCFGRKLLTLYVTVTFPIPEDGRNRLFSFQIFSFMRGVLMGDVTKDSFSWMRTCLL